MLASGVDQPFGEHRATATDDLRQVDACARGSEEPSRPDPDLRPLIFSPGVVEQRYLHRPRALRQTRETLRERFLHHLRQVAARVYPYEGGGVAGKSGA